MPEHLRCPTCNATWEKIVTKTTVELRSRAEESESLAYCIDGHEFRLTSVVADPHGSLSIVVPIAPPPVAEVRATADGCSACGKPIQPGQVYVVERVRVQTGVPTKVRHIGC